MKLFRTCVIAIFFCILSSSGYSLEVFSFYSDNCTSLSGFLVYVDATSFRVLDFDGNIQQYPRYKIEAIARYNILENPLPNFEATDQGYFFEVAAESQKGRFFGYVVSFFEGMVFFYDASGKVRVLESDNLLYLKPLNQRKNFSPAKYAPVTLNPPELKRQCPSVKSKNPKNLVFSQQSSSLYLNDKLKIETFFGDRLDGYRNLESLSERTLFYSRPLMFDQKTRLGITYFSQLYDKKYELMEQPVEALPAYIEFGGGQPYRFQSHTSIGTQTLAEAPSFRKFGAIRSEFKSHILHGQFIGNYAAFAAGRSVYSNLYRPTTARRAVWSDQSFNHMTLLGADFSPYSISYGYYFPVFAFGSGEEFREVLANTTSPVFQFGLKFVDWDFDLFLFYTKFRDSVDPAKISYRTPEQYGESSLNFYSQKVDVVNFKLQSYATRFNATFRAQEGLQFQGSLLYRKTEYKEDAAVLNLTRYYRTSGPFPERTGAITSHRIVTQVIGAGLGARLDLGQWVGLSTKLSYDIQTHSGSLGDDPSVESEAKDKFLSGFAGFEFIL